MTESVPAVYEKGFFRPLEPVSCHEQERDILTVQGIGSPDELLDEEFLAYCETQADDTVALEAAPQTIAQVPVSLTDDNPAERDQRRSAVISLTPAVSS